MGNDCAKTSKTSTDCNKRGGAQTPTYRRPTPPPPPKPIKK